MPELWQAEWCPHSAEVRSAMTELGVSFVARQVPADPEERDAMKSEVGRRKIPVVRLPDGTVLDGDDHEIVAGLRERYAKPPGAERHRQKARAHGDLGG